jgi:hypothetical protein
MLSDNFRVNNENVVRGHSNRIAQITRVECFFLCLDNTFPFHPVRHLP